MIDSAEPAIIVDRVSKEFKLPHEKTTSIKSMFVNFYRTNKGYDMFSALRDVSFEIKKGEFFGIVGRNGSGKSTLLKLLAGIYVPNNGSVTVNGKLTPFIELGVGFNMDLTGRENVYLNGALLGFSRKEMRAMYDDIVEFAELEKFMDQKLKNYSSGMQVRLAFSIAIRAQSDILLIDEVLAVGDAAFQRKSLEYFKQLKKDKKTVVFVSHDMGAVREFCDRGILIDGGKIKFSGNAEELAHEYMKIFTVTKDEEELANRERARTGNGDVAFGNVTCTVRNNIVRVKASVDANKDVEDLVYGIHIFSEDGQEVAGMNNPMLQKPDVVGIKKGFKIEFDWEIGNVFKSGNYDITLSLVKPDGTMLDHLVKATSFNIKRPEKSNSWIVPPIEVRHTIKGK